MMRVNEKFLSFEMWKHIAGEHKNWSHFLPAWMAGEDPLLWAKDPERVFEPKPIYVPYYVDGAEKVALTNIYYLQVYSKPERWEEYLSLPVIINAVHNIRMTWRIMDMQRLDMFLEEKINGKEVYVCKKARRENECSSGAFPISGCSCTCKCSGLSFA